ncbi:class I SAM-dependent methyltransferase [Rhizobium herbae]
MNDSTKTHWENVYSRRTETSVSWFQEMPKPSLDLLELVGAGQDWKIVDIGGGASRLVDCFVMAGYIHVTVLDLCDAALACAQRRLGERSEYVRWVVSDVRDWGDAGGYDVWHDRAAFHFLTKPSDQESYARRLRRSLRDGGFAIVGTFALDGPEKCSGLPVTRHDSESIGRVLGPDFKLVDHRRHDHLTPSGAMQKFQFSTFVLG